MHPDSLVLVKGLSDYQGPALLAYNNTLFLGERFPVTDVLGRLLSIKEASTHDVRYAMDSFANDMGSNGLLFLKSAQRIVLSIDDQ
jgi:hypothetical protein